MSHKLIAFVFPRQGSQRVGMLAAAHERFKVVRDTFSEASQLLGYEMWDLVRDGAQEALNLTETTHKPFLVQQSGGSLPSRFTTNTATSPFTAINREVHLHLLAFSTAASSAASSSCTRFSFAY